MFVPAAGEPRTGSRNHPRSVLRNHPRTIPRPVTSLSRAECGPGDTSEQRGARRSSGPVIALSDRGWNDLLWTRDEKISWNQVKWFEFTFIETNRRTNVCENNISSINCLDSHRWATTRFLLNCYFCRYWLLNGASISIISSPPLRKNGNFDLFSRSLIRKIQFVLPLDLDSNLYSFCYNCSQQCNFQRTDFVSWTPNRN